MRVAVLGSSGLLGSFLEFAFDRWFGWAVVPISRTDPSRNPHHIRFKELTEVPDIVRRGEFDVVVNCIAMASHEGCEINSQEAFKTNSVFPGDLAAGCEESRSHLVHISTDAVFDGPHSQPFSEEDIPMPVSVYGVTKLEGERRVAIESPGALILRTNFFSWSRNGRHGVLDFFYSALSRGEAVNGFTDYFTSSLYAGDLAGIIRSLIKVEQSGVIHAVAAQASSKFEFGRSVASVFGFDPTIVIASSLASQNFLAHRAPDLSLSSAMLEGILGVESPSSMEGLERAKEDMDEFWAFLGRSKPGLSSDGN